MDNKATFILMDLFGVDDLGEVEKIVVKNTPVVDLHELEYHAGKFDGDKKYNRSKWIKMAIKHFNSHMRMLEDVDGDPYDFLFSTLHKLIQTKPHKKEEMMKRLQEFIDNNGN